jgi:hypothetical protein
MEEGEEEQKPVEDSPPPPDPEDEGVREEELEPLEGVPSTPVSEEGGVKVNVINPFKPSVRISRVVRQGKCYYHPAKPASYLCASCGKSICNVCGRNISGTYFCPQCAPASLPIAQSVTPAPKEPDTSWYKAVLAIGVIFILIGAILLLGYWPLSSISAAEYENLLEDYRNDGGHNLKDYRPGDIITVRDTIIRLRVDHDANWGVITLLWFESTGKDDNDFWMTFDADLERDYHVGDDISITLHVEEDSRTHDEVIREDNNNLPDISNIDHTASIDMVFIAMIAIGSFLVIIYFLFAQKIKDSKPNEAESKGTQYKTSQSKSGDKY